ncbi:MAG: hypothetical protein ACRCUM_03910 [Mycoplasmoidaceae bacterium]
MENFEKKIYELLKEVEEGKVGIDFASQMIQLYKDSLELFDIYKNFKKKHTIF